MLQFLESAFMLYSYIHHDSDRQQKPLRTEQMTVWKKDHRNCVTYRTFLEPTQLKFSYAGLTGICLLTFVTYLWRIKITVVSCTLDFQSSLRKALYIEIWKGNILEGHKLLM
jgi:hypothetical protein